MANEKRPVGAVLGAGPTSGDGKRPEDTGATAEPDAKPTATTTTSTAPVGRLSRFAKITGLTAGVAARHVAHKVKSAFHDDEEAKERSERETRQKSAAQMTKTLGELKGAAMKVGQMLATDPELLPKEMADELAQLQHSAPPMDFATVKQVVETALGVPLDDAFSSFSREPIGAASIGQVHRATTKEGQDVAVKVQYPGIGDTIKSDMKNLGSLLVLARAGLPKERVDAYLDEVTSVIERESDYLNEAANLERFQIVLKDVEGVRVPVPVHELTRKTVLVMEFFAGKKLEDWLMTAAPADKTAQGQRLLQAYLQMIHVHGALHADPHPGNFLVLDAPPGATGVPPIGILDLGCVRDYPVAFMDDILRFLASLWTHDLARIQERWRALGFIDKHVDPEAVYDWLNLIFEPLLFDKETDFGAWKVQEQAMRMLLDNPSLKLFAPPREIVFYVRVLAGLRALMHKTGTRLNVYRLSREVVRARGI